MTTPTRRLPFAGPTNFRDLGGYDTTSGRQTKWGTVFRADALHRLTEGDMELYDSLGIKTVYDLRSDRERAAHADPFANVHIPLLSPDGARAAANDLTDAKNLLRNTYRGMLIHAAPLFGTLLTALAGPEALPAVFHCAGGKDRTGLSAALLLDVLGVDRETILDDYELTSASRRPQQRQESYEGLIAMGLAPEAAASVLGAPRSVMDDSLREMEEQYGSLEQYLLGPAGMQKDTLERLRSLLTE